MNSDFTVYDVAKLTGRSPAAIRRLARLGKAKGAYKVAGVWFFNREVVETLRAGGVVPE